MTTLCQRLSQLQVKQRIIFEIRFVKVWTAKLKALCSQDMASTEKLKKIDNKEKHRWNEVSDIVGSFDWKQARKLA